MSTSAFDTVAESYDADFTYSAIGLLQRKRVYKYIIPLLNKQKSVLEINCGTGFDALTIAKQVKSVLATDISEEMVRVSKKKNSSEKVNFLAADINSLHQHLDDKYDLLLSNFGGLNCLVTEELKQFSKNISPYIHSHGHLALVIMGKKCLWENLFFYKQNDKRLYRRDTNEGVETTINGIRFKTYYYSPEQIQQIFSNEFERIMVKPIGLFIPPSYLNAYFSNKKMLLRFLNFLEKIFGKFSFLSNYADHYILILRKK
jgi:SAM-dependent methyltransferase